MILGAKELKTDVFKIPSGYMKKLKEMMNRELTSYFTSFLKIKRNKRASVQFPLILCGKTAWDYEQTALF